MTQIAISVPAGYTAALNAAALADENTAGRIFMGGRDRAALLHRLSTNNIERLQDGQGTRTVLTTPIGRIIDLLNVYVINDVLLVVTSPGQGGVIWSHLKKNIFFNDQVALTAAGRSHGQLALYGPAAASLFGADAAVTLSRLPMHHITTLEFAGVPIMVARREPIGGPSFTLFVPSEHLEAARNSLIAAGAEILDAATLDILRVEQGYAAFGSELSQEYIPLETNLLDAISFSKGCYVGQEIIARMESRGRLAKQLRGLRINSDSALSVPAKLDVAGKEAGDLTSMIISPRFGPIALAYVRSAYAEPGTHVGIAGSDVQAQVVELPFSETP